MAFASKCDEILRYGRTVRLATDEREAVTSEREAASLELLREGRHLYLTALECMLCLNNAQCHSAWTKRTVTRCRKAFVARPRARCRPQLRRARAMARKVPSKKRGNAMAFLFEETKPDLASS